MDCKGKRSMTPFWLSGGHALGARRKAIAPSPLPDAGALHKAPAGLARLEALLRRSNELVSRRTEVLYEFHQLLLVEV